MRKNFSNKNQEIKGLRTLLFFSHQYVPAVFCVLIAYFLVGKVLLALGASSMDIGDVIGQDFVRA